MPSLQHSPWVRTTFFPGISCKENGLPRPRSPRTMSRGWLKGGDQAEHRKAPCTNLN